MANTMGNYKIKFTTAQVPATPLTDNVSPGYRAIVQLDHTMDIDEALDTMLQLADSEVNKETFKYCVGMFVQKLPTLLASTGCAVRLGDLGKLYPVIQGIFPEADSAFSAERNRLSIKWQTRPEFRIALDGVGFENISGSVDPNAPLLKSVVSAYTGVTNEFGYGGPDGEVGTWLNGRNVMFNESRNDEGLWLYSEDGTTLIGKTAAAVNTPTAIGVQYSADNIPADGEKVTVVLRTRGKGAAADAPLVEFRKVATVKRG